MKWLCARVGVGVGLIVTHLLALGAGWWMMERHDSDARSSLSSPPPRSTKRSARQEHRVSADELIAAYGQSDFWMEAQRKRLGKEQEAVPSEPPVRPKMPDERAAEITDIAGALQKELEAVNRHAAHDYILARALIARWMKEDAKACAAWLGKMDGRVGWGDPFDAFAASRPPLELLDLMDDTWLRVDRRRALEYLAQHTGSDSAAELPAILARLEGEEARSFLDRASDHARVDDASVWLAMAGDDRQRLNQLATRWIHSPSRWEFRNGEWVADFPMDPDWRKQAELALKAAEGTAAEEVFNKRWQEQSRAGEVSRLFAMVPREPEAAIDGLAALAMEQGHDETEARQIANRQIAAQYPDGLESWRQGEWEQSLQQSILGDRGFGEVLLERLVEIRDDLPESLQGSARNASLRDAMTVDPAATLEIARKNGLIEDAVTNGAKIVASDASTAVKADVLLALAEQGLWKNRKDLPTPDEFAAKYALYDPAAAKLWRTRLPSSLLKSEPGRSQ